MPCAIDSSASVTAKATVLSSSLMSRAISSALILSMFALFRLRLSVFKLLKSVILKSSVYVFIFLYIYYIESFGKESGVFGFGIHTKVLAVSNLCS